MGIIQVKKKVYLVQDKLQYIITSMVDIENDTSLFFPIIRLDQPSIDGKIWI